MSDPEPFVVDHALKCDKCDAPMGSMSEFYPMTPRLLPKVLSTCMVCLPAQLNEVEATGYDPEVIARLRTELGI